mgnify:CR=1 FL=1
MIKYTEGIKFEDMINKVVWGDCLEVMRLMKDKSVDLVITSPPYDNLRDYQGYDFNFEGIAKELFRIVKDGGVVVWVVGDATIDGSETGTSFKQALYFKEIGFNLHDTMIYQKINYIPLTHKRYEQEFEYMFVLSRGGPKTFNPLLKKNKLGGKKYNPNRPRDYDGNAIRHNRSEELTFKEYGQKGNIFGYIVGAGNEKTNHPATFPEKLVSDHIKSWSNEGDIVLDPMNGSGTTTKTAKQLGRNFIGIEISEKYCKIADDRLRQEILPL